MFVKDLTQCLLIGSCYFLLLIGRSLEQQLRVV